MSIALRRMLIGGLLAAVVIVAGVVAWFIIESQRLNSWIATDEGRLHPYSIILVDEGGAVVPLPEPPLDVVLLEHTARHRHVLELTRSEYRFSRLGREAWVKIHLVTGSPEDERIRARIKLLKKLQRKGGNWSVTSVHELALP